MIYKIIRGSTHFYSNSPLIGQTFYLYSLINSSSMASVYCPCSINLLNYVERRKMKKSIFRDIRNRWKKTEGFLNGEETRVKSVRKNRVDNVRKIIDKNNFGLEETACVELLLLECNEKLAETRKSEIVNESTK